MHHDSMIGTPVFPHFFCSYLASVFIRFSFCMFSTCLDIQRSRTYRQKSLKKSQSQHIVFKPFTIFLKQVMMFWEIKPPQLLVSIFYLPIKSGSAHYFSTAIFSFLCCILVPEMVVLEEVSDISMLSRSHALEQNFNQEKAPSSPLLLLILQQNSQTLERKRRFFLTLLLI